MVLSLWNGGNSIKLILQRHMIMDYSENNKVTSQLRYPKLVIASAFAEYDILVPVDCVFGGIGLSRQQTKT